MMSEAGSFAEFAALTEDQCVKLPPSLPFTEAASMAIVYDTAYFALKDRGRIQGLSCVLHSLRNTQYAIRPGPPLVFHPDPPPLRHPQPQKTRPLSAAPLPLSQPHRRHRLAQHP
jgi:hypothetical protein